MKRVWLYISFLAIVLLDGVLSAPRITIYECKYIPAEQIAHNDSISDDIWNNAKLNTSFYEYWLPEPGIAAFKTGFRMYYSDEGIHLSIIFFEDQSDKIKATRTTRGDSELWKDDCVEIYFDPINSGIGYLKFTANLLGTKHNLKVYENTGVIDLAWNPDWQVNVKKTTEGFEMMVFISWDVFQIQPKKGDVWTFNLVRYRYSTGNFQGATWSPGGSYASPNMFGNILFGSGISKEVEVLARAIEFVKGNSWEFVSDSGIVTYNSFQQLLLKKIDVLEDKINNGEWRFFELQYNDEFLSTLKHKLTIIKEEVTNGVIEISNYESHSRELKDINSQLKKIIFKAEIDFLLSNKEDG